MGPPSASSGIEFETPENVRIRYPLAGPGTRFLAWLLDQVLVLVLTVAVCVALLVAGIASGTLTGYFEGFDAPDLERQAPQVTQYFIGGMLLVMAFGSFLYFFCSELLLRGQTIGKRLLGLRVVKANGFALDPLSLFLRNAFRGVDHLAPFWTIPVLSTRTQRAGDMAAGTLVIRERQESLSPLRQELADRSPLECRFRFDGAALARLRPVDVSFIESLVDRWNELSRAHLRQLLDRAIGPLCVRMSIAPPPAAERLTFCEELLSAEYRRRRS